ncbi:CD59A glycoprotein-like [Lissotriton helveticus]
MKLTALLLFLAVVVCTGEALKTYKCYFVPPKGTEMSLKCVDCLQTFKGFEEHTRCITMEECENHKLLSPDEDIRCCQSDVCNKSPGK